MIASEQEAKSTDATKRAECSQCGGSRNCDILGHYDQKGGDEDFQWHTEWRLLQCRGCDHVFVQTVSTNSEDYENDYGPDGEPVTDYTETIRYWPALSKRKKPEWMSDGGIDADEVDALDASLAELYGALNNDLNMLAAIGIRTSFDIAAELLGMDSKQSFRSKLEKLVTDGHIGKVDQSRLEALVDAGSASAHRGWRPNPDELDTMMDVLEHFVHDAFVAPWRKKRLDPKLAKIKAKVPSRNPKAAVKK